ncbi:MAG: hypothetical protein P1U63_01240 [Coxiellaceae bacterium]|nr:hypothetical protein [Coxiellaceae bacterium]
MRHYVTPLILLCSHTLVAAQLSTSDFISNKKHTDHTVTAPVVVSRTEAWNLRSTPNLYAKITRITFYHGTNLSTGRCSGIGRTLDLSDNHYTDTGLALNGPAGALANINISAAGFTKAANQLGYSIPSNGNACAQLFMDFKAGPESSTNKINIFPDTRPFEYTNIVSLHDNIISSGTAVNNHFNLLKNSHLTLQKPSHAVCWGNGMYGQLGTEKQFSEGTPQKILLSKNNHIIKIASGYEHSCVLLDSGSVKCFGHNHHGQLGNGTTTDSKIPETPTGLSNNIIDISSGRHSTCTLSKTGTVKCWGENAHGQLGDGTTIERHVPTAVIGLGSNVKSLHAGGEHTCALLTDGRITCWGENRDGQLGNNSTTSSYTPVLVQNIGGQFPKAITLSAGGAHSCALLATGAVKCWGLNHAGQIGDNTLFNRTIPTAVIGLSSGVTKITSGIFHSCAIQNGKAKCWGQNRDGEIGIAQTSDIVAVPTNVRLLSSNVTDIQAHDRHTCAIDSGVTKCWGDNVYGQIGIGNNSRTDTVTLPRTVVKLKYVDAVSLNVGNISEFNCAIVKPKNVKSPTLSYHINSVELANIGFGNASLILPRHLAQRGITTDCPLTLSANHSCRYTYKAGSAASDRGHGIITVHATSATSDAFPFYIQHHGSVKCWGDNYWGQLGDGTREERHQATESPFTSYTTQLVSGHAHTCRLTTDGRVQCWGRNTYGQLGDGTSFFRTRPVEVANITDAVSLTAGNDYTCALLKSSEVKCWGENDKGQLGNNSYKNSYVPVTVHSLSTGVSAIAAGRNHTCALLRTGHMMCWGDNSRGQLGDSTLSTRPVPVAVSSLSSNRWHVASIAAGANNSCAILSNGTMKCWGANFFGQLGIGNTDNPKTTPQLVQGLIGNKVAAVAIGALHICAQTNAGGMYCWGYNTNGQLGLGNFDRLKTLPQQVPGLVYGVVGISATDFGTCALKSGGKVLCWGENHYGEVGDGTTEKRNTPTTVKNINKKYVYDLSTSNGNAAHNCVIEWRRNP